MKKILIIEDEKILAEMYRDKFTLEGFEVILAFESGEGLELVKKEKPDIILLDILLPGESGIFFLKKLRENPQIAKTPVVVFSNYDDPETKKEAAKLGVKEYLVKANFTPQEIIEKVKEHVI